MVQWLSTALRRLNKHAQIVTRGGLSDKFAQRFRPQSGVDIFRPFVRCGQAIVVSHAGISPSVLNCSMDPETSSG
jgi:hypothetical protein